MEALPKRGSRLCRHCGTVNGNRAYACKSCHGVFGGNTDDRKQLQIGKKRPSTDVSDFLSTQPKPKKVYSVRVRERGPDYRTFVSAGEGGHWECHYDSCKIAEEARGRSSIQNAENSLAHCSHIALIKDEAHDTTAGSGPGVFPPIALSADLLHTLPFPPNVREELQLAAQTLNGNLIRRVSEETFLVQNTKRTQEHQFGLMHVRMYKTKSGPNSSRTFHCPCSTYKRYTLHPF